MSACSNDFIIVDLTPPTDNGSNPQFIDDYDTNGNDINISWTAFSDINLTQYEIITYSDADCSLNEINHGMTTDTSTTNNTLINSLTDGEYYLKIIAYDGAGNSKVGLCSTDKVVVDLINPSAPVVDNPNVNVSTPIIAATWTEGTDTNFYTHNLKACLGNDCATGCIGATTSVTSPANINVSMNNSYYVCIQTVDLAGRTSDWISSGTSIEVRNFPPDLVPVADQPSAAENSAITTVDVDGDFITYNCYYDQSIDAAVDEISACGEIAGLSFNQNSGIFNWTPGYFQAGNYEFKIVASSQTLSDGELFSIIVNNSDRAPVISGIADQIVNEAATISVDPSDILK